MDIRLTTNSPLQEEGYSSTEDYQEGQLEIDSPQEEPQEIDQPLGIHQAQSIQSQQILRPDAPPTNTQLNTTQDTHIYEGCEESYHADAEYQDIIIPAYPGLKPRPPHMLPKIKKNHRLAIYYQLKKTTVTPPPTATPLPTDIPAPVIKATARPHNRTPARPTQTRTPTRSIQSRTTTSANNNNNNARTRYEIMVAGTLRNLQSYEPKKH